MGSGDARAMSIHVNFAVGAARAGYMSAPRLNDCVGDVGRRRRSEIRSGVDFASFGELTL